MILSPIHLPVLVPDTGKARAQMARTPQDHRLRKGEARSLNAWLV